MPAVVNSSHSGSTTKRMDAPRASTSNSRDSLPSMSASTVCPMDSTPWRRLRVSWRKCSPSMSPTAPSLRNPVTAFGLAYEIVPEGWIRSTPSAGRGASALSEGGTRGNSPRISIWVRISAASMKFSSRAPVARIPIWFVCRSMTAMGCSLRSTGIAHTSTGMPALSALSLVSAMSRVIQATETGCSGSYSTRSPTMSSSSAVGPVTGRTCAVHSNTSPGSVPGTLRHSTRSEKLRSASRCHWVTKALSHSSSVIRSTARPTAST